MGYKARGKEKMDCVNDDMEGKYMLYRRASHFDKDKKKKKKKNYIMTYRKTLHKHFTALIGDYFSIIIMLL